MISLAQRFCDGVRPRADAPLAGSKEIRRRFEAWLEKAQHCGVRAVETFAEGLPHDAVLALMQTPWSNGQCEGQVTRLKFLKRQMYGRAGFDLLRRRVLLTS